MVLVCAYKLCSPTLTLVTKRLKHVEQTPHSLQTHLLSGFLRSGGLVCQTASLKAKETSILFYFSDQIYLPKLSFYPGIYAS